MTNPKANRRTRCENPTGCPCARFTVHASHEDTAGRYDLIEGGGPPGFQAPLHRHNRYAEQLYVVEGEFTVWAGKQTAVLHPGDAFTIPAGTCTPWP